MKTHLSISRSRGGFTYMTVVVTMIIVGVMLAAYLTMISVQNQLVQRSQAWNRSVPIIEAGIEEAIAHLNHNAAADAGGIFNVNLATDGWSVHPLGGWYKTNAIGDDYYWVRITQFVAGNYYPFIEAEGYVLQQQAFAMNHTRGPFLAQVGANVSVTPGYTKRSVVCTTTNVPVFSKALIARKGIDISGQNVRTDSFDSSNPLYSDGFGHYTNTTGKWRVNGDIASNDAVTNTINAGSANIYGKVSTGPNGTVYLSSGGLVGDVNWQSTHTSGIQPGWSTDDMNMDFPSVVVPTALYGGTPPTGQTITTNGVTYSVWLKSSPGTTNDYDMQGQTLSGKVYVEGTVRLLVRAGINMSGQDRITLAPGATLFLYADCESSQLGGNGVQNPGTAEHFYYLGTDKNVNLAYGGNAAFTAVFYAPNAALSMSGGGSSIADFSGSAIAKTIKITGNFNFHYDENLKRVGLFRGYVVTSWNER